MSEEAGLFGKSAERWLNLAALLVAPASLITGLCYFFGLLFINHRLKYFGVDPSALGYASADYVVTTVGLFFFAAFRALVVCALVVLLAVAVRHWAATGKRIKLLRVVGCLVLAVGAIAVGSAVVWLAFDYPLINSMAGYLNRKPDTGYTAWSIFCGTGLLVAGYWILTITGGVKGGNRLPRRAERALLVVSVIGMVVALFWITDLYAVDEGTSRAKDRANLLWSADGDYTAVQLDTTDALNLPPAFVKTTVLPAAGPPAAPTTTPTYRYECLRVLEQHGGHYILVPARWQHDHGFAITVTPDATHRITGITRSARTGDDVNISPFWQCPEVVRTFRDTDLEPMLIGPDTAQTITGTPTLIPGPITAAMPAPSSAAATNSCASQSNPTNVPAVIPYPDKTVASRENEFTGDSPTGKLYIRQRVTDLPDAPSAAALRAEVWDRWDKCAGHTVTTDRESKSGRRTLGPRGETKDIRAVADSALGSTVNDCAQALAVKSNIVIQVDVCGSQQAPNQAVGIAAAVRDRIPSDTNYP